MHGACISFLSTRLFHSFLYLSWYHSHRSLNPNCFYGKIFVLVKYSHYLELKKKCQQSMEDDEILNLAIDYLHNECYEDGSTRQKQKEINPQKS